MHNFDITSQLMRTNDSEKLNKFASLELEKIQC